MNTHIRISLLSGSLLLALMSLLTGCGTAPASSGGYGADAGPWPQSPPRGTSAVPATPEKPREVPVTFTVRGKASEKGELRLQVTQLDLRYGDRWYTVAKTDELTKSETQPLKLAAKETFAMLASATVPVRKYSYVRLTFAKEQCVLVRENTPDLPVTVTSVPLAIGDWTPSDAKPNLITISVNGTKLSLTNGAALPAESFAAKALSPAGGISGKVTPAAPTTRVDLYWGGSKLLLGSATPSAQDGSFTVSNLPAGLYRVDVKAPDQRLAEPLKELVAVEDKVVALKPMELVAADAVIEPPKTK